MSLLSDKIRHYMKTGVTFGQKGHAHPFKWNEKLERPELCRSKRGRFIWLFNFGFSAFYFCFILVQNLRVNFNRDSSKIQKIYMRFVLIDRFFLMIAQLANFVKGNQLPEFASQFSTLMKQFQEDLKISREEDGEKSREPKKAEKTLIPKIYELFLDAFCFSAGAAEVGLAFLSIIRPNSPEFLSAVLIPFAGERKILKVFFRVFSVLFQLYFEYIYTSNVFLWFLPGFGYIFTEIVALRQIKALSSTGNGNGAKKNPCKFSREKVQRILKMYRLMEILQKSLHDTFGTIIFPAAKLTAMGITILSSYGVFKMEGILVGFFGFMAIAVFLSFVLLMETWAEFHRNSQEILHRMKSPQFQNSLNLYEKKMLKSFNLIQIKMGSSYVIDKRCVVTVIKIVADSTMNFLLANR